MRITKKDQFLQEDGPLLGEIKQMKEGVNAKEELVVTRFYRKIGIDLLFTFISILFNQF